MTTDVHPPTVDTAARDQRVERLIAEMTLTEKLAQLVGLWEGCGDEGPGDGTDGDVAPMQAAMRADDDTLRVFARDGLGQLTRPYGTAPVDAADRRRDLAEQQRWLRESTRLGIPALVHEECLTGLAAWGATTFPAPPAWGASFDAGLVEQVGAAIGATMRALGVHQGLAPVLDVVRDARWGRVEECIAEDPWLVGEIGGAYVRGVQGTGVLATLKHFVGYSASRAGRNLAPVHAGPREVTDVLLVPFEMAVLDAGAASVMNSYAEVDGLPVAADEDLLTGVLRDRWGFTGTVVADYFSVAFLHTLHRVADGLGDAAAQALSAGIDVELPTGAAYLAPLAERVRDGRLDEAVVDRALRRVLAQKDALGLLDASTPDVPDGDLDLDPPSHRALAARLAEESVVLLENDGTLPLASAAGRVAVVGPNADDVGALFGCYSFANHVLPHHPGTPLRLDVSSVLDAVRAELPDARVDHVRGCDVDGDDRAGLDAAADLAREADLVVAVVGDRAGLFGRGTSGEGCDAADLELPGVQRELVERCLDTGTPLVLVLLTGRPYAVGWAQGRCAAVVQAFFPGQEGAGAIAGVLSGRVDPSGRLPVSMPGSAAGQPYSYLHPPLGGPNPVSNLDPSPAWPFGHGLTYTRFALDDLVVDAEAPTSGRLVARCRVTNTGERAGTEVVQLYASVPVASTTRPTTALLAHARVELEAGRSAEVRLEVPTTRLARSDRRLTRVVEPGAIGLAIGRSCEDLVLHADVELTGPPHTVTTADARLAEVDVRWS